MNKVEKLLNKVRKAMYETEYGITNIAGVDCSYSDLETLELFCNELLEKGNLSNFIVIGEPQRVLKNLGIIQ